MSAKKKKWTKAQREKFIATMKAKREGNHDATNPKSETKGVSLPPSREAIALLQQAERSMFKDLRAGNIKSLHRDQILSLLALDILRG